jgi:hypothetical protein
MELLLKRNTFTPKSTIGSLFVDDVPQCYLLEDTDRGLTSTMSLPQIKALKIFGETAIPYGRYRIIITKSERFSKKAGHDVFLPQLLNVPGFEGIRIHPGNKPEDSEGCQLPGTEKHTNEVRNSRTAFVKLETKINDALKAGEEVWITITKDILV